MANGSNRDVNLTLNIGTLGEENVTKLQKSLTALANEGGKGAEEFAQLANEIGRLGEQNQALQAFKALSDRSDALQQRVETLGTSFDQLKVKVTEAKDAQAQSLAVVQRTTAAHDEAKRAVVESRNAIATLKAEHAAGTVSSTAFGESLMRLTKGLNDSKLAVHDTGTAARDAKQSYTELSSEVGKLETQYKRQEKALSSAGEAYRSQASDLHAAADAAQSLGVDVSDLASAETRLADSFIKTQRSAIARKESLDEMAEADRLAGIEAQAMAALIDKGAIALQAEEAAFREATEAAQRYAQAKADAQAQAANWQQEAEQIVEAVEARQRLTAATERQIEVQRAANAAIEENARNLQQAKEDDFAATVRVLTQELERLEAQEKAVADATARINNSFQKLDTKPIADIEREITEVREAMAVLASSGSVTGNALNEAFSRGEAKIKELEREIRSLNGTLTIADRAANLFKNSMGQIAAGNLLADAIGSLVEKIKELGREFVAVIARTEALRRGLNAVYKDAAVTASQMEFLRNTAMNAGIAVGGIQANFLKFAASTKAANIPLQVTNELFASVTRAAGTLGLSGEEVSGMLEALSQMASKGTVSMEELRQQLGDRLPGALSLVAKGLGITEAQLIKLVEAGNLSARDMFPALTQALKSMHGEVSGLTATWENFKNVLTGAAQDAGDAGWATILTGALKVLIAVFGGLLLTLSQVWEAFRMVGVGAVTLFETLRGNGKQALEFFNDELDKSLTRLELQKNRLVLALDPTNAYAKSVLAAAESNTKASTAIAAVNAELGKIQTVLGTSTEAIRAQAAVSNILADKTKDVGAKMVAVSVYIAEQTSALEKRIVALGKEAKAQQESGAASVALATLRGDELGILEAQAAAANANAEAIAKVAAATQQEVDLLIIHRNAIVQATLAAGESLDTRKQELEALDKKIEKSRAENEQAQASLKALEQDRLARRVAIETYGNQSAQIEKLRLEYEQLSRDVLLAKVAFDQKRITSEQLKSVEEKLAVAAAKYSDAVRDQITMINAKNSIVQSEINLQTTKLQVAQSDLLQQAAAARATGNLTLAIQKEIEAKELQIKITQLKAKAAKAEADASVMVAEAQLAELKQKEPLNEAKRLEIEARLQNAKAKQLEAGAAKSVIDGLEQEIRNLRQFGSAQGAATQSREADTVAMAANTSERERSIAAREKEIELAERENALYREKWNIDKAGFTLNTKGDRVSAAAGTEKYVYTAATNAGLSEADALSLVSRFIRNGEMVGWQDESARGGSWWTAVDKAIDAKILANARDRNSGSAGTSGTSSTGTNSSGSNRTVTIVINGRKQNVNVASQSDADKLESILRELENSSGTSA